MNNLAKSHNLKSPSILDLERRSFLVARDEVGSGSSSEHVLWNTYQLSVRGAEHPFNNLRERTYGKDQTCRTSVTRFIRPLMRPRGSPSRGGNPNPSYDSGVEVCILSSMLHTLYVVSQLIVKARGLWAWPDPRPPYNSKMFGLLWEEDEWSFARLVKVAVGVTGGQKGHRSYGNLRPAGEIFVPRSEPGRFKSTANQLERIRR